MYKRQLLTNFVANPVSALMNGNYIGILFWACMFGIAMKNIGACLLYTSRCV